MIKIKRWDFQKYQNEAFDHLKKIDGSEGFPTDLVAQLATGGP